jgi:flagellar motility protein MotE (MotC chaperone)
MKMLAHPAVLVALGLLLGVGTSLGVIWTAAGPLVRELATKRTKAQKPERPEQPWDFWTIEIEGLASELKEAKAALKQREDALALRETRLASEQKELAKTRKQVEALRAEIGDKMVEVKADEAKNLKTLSNTFRTLTPKAAVTILLEMEPQTVVKALSLMKTDEVGALFEEMAKSPDPAVVKRAAVLSDRIRLLKAARTAATP